ncbi:AraC family transcriptional regulator [Streptomyces sp. NPDC015532]|uniref:AraC family transcriptional regulator n=1 Tax=Streptomyces sp. NPDC015532 TaxID=3364960 RepID=UPI0036F6E15E
MVDVGVERGVVVPACLDGSGVDENALADDAAHVRAWQELTVAQNLVRATGDAPGLGLEVGSRIPLRTYSVLGFALLASPTLREAAAVGLRYLELTFAMVGIHLQEDGNEVRLVLDDGLVPPPVRHFFVEREIANIRAILDTIVGRPFTPLRLDLRFPRPEESAPYEVFDDVPIAFGAPRNAIVTLAAVLEQSLPQADQHTMQVCERECRLLLARRTTDTGFAVRVRELLMQWPDGIPDMGAAAAALHLSTRTLHRRLAVEDTSYRRLVDAARHARAVEMLSDLGLGVDQIAARLGYADAAAFIRAFRRWTGATPGAYRTRSVRNLSRARA